MNGAPFDHGDNADDPTGLIGEPEIVSTTPAPAGWYVPWSNRCGQTHKPVAQWAKVHCRGVRDTGYPVGITQHGVMVAADDGPLLQLARAEDGYGAPFYAPAAILPSPATPLVIDGAIVRALRDLAASMMATPLSHGTVENIETLASGMHDLATLVLKHGLEAALPDGAA